MFGVTWPAVPPPVSTIRFIKKTSLGGSLLYPIIGVRGEKSMVSKERRER